jgi:hypothetical protein
LTGWVSNPLTEARSARSIELELPFQACSTDIGAPVRGVESPGETPDLAMRGDGPRS